MQRVNCTTPYNSNAPCLSTPLDPHPFPSCIPHPSCNLIHARAYCCSAFCSICFLCRIRLQVLIFNLLPPPGSPPLAPDERGAAWEPPSLAVEVQADVVSAMEQAVLLVPALPSRLLPMLVANIPHKLRDRQTQCLYARALLLLAEGRVASALREPLLLGLVEQLLSIDADIKWEDIVETPMGAPPLPALRPYYSHRHCFKQHCLYKFLLICFMS